MGRSKVLVVYVELSILKVSVSLRKPLYTVPMVTASKHGEENVFGNDALEKDESWQLAWLHGGDAQPELHKDLFRFVFKQTKVQKALGKCKSIVIPYQCILGEAGEGLMVYSRNIIYSIGKLSLRPYCTGEDRLSLVGRHKLGLRFSFNISGNITSIWSCDQFEGIPVYPGFIRVGFETILNLFIKLLCEKGYDFTAQRDRLFCEKLVMDYCYVALDFEKELERIENLDGPLHEVKLEDGTVLELGKECIVATEILFNPRLVGMDEKSIMSLFQRQNIIPSYGCVNVIFSGGCAPALKGLGERIQRELETMDDKYIVTPVNIIKTDVREDAIRFSKMRSLNQVMF